MAAAENLERRVQGTPPGVPLLLTPLAKRRPLSILLLCDDTRKHANTILDHIAAFARFSQHKVSIYNPRGVARSRTLDLDEFDVVVIHYSLCIIVDHYLPPDLREKLRRFRGLKIQFIQDDYRWVDDITALMRHIGIDILFTLVPEPEIPKIWDEGRLPGVLKINTLAGYVPEDLLARPVAAFEQRPLDIGYRGRVLPYWIGRIGQEKAWIAQGIQARAERYGLKCDVGWRETDRIYGKSWVSFISSCRATLGSESGATITDFDGSIERAVKAYVAEHPHADFGEVHGAILAPHENNIRMNVISPRIFEAIALRTGLILFPGEYSGVLRPRDHYLCLAKDFSNMDEMVERLKDPVGMQAMIARAFREIGLSGQYSLGAFIRQFDEVVWQHGRPHGRPLKVFFRMAKLEKAWRPKELWEKSRIPWLARLAFRGCLTLKFTLTNHPLRRAMLGYPLEPKLWRAAPLSRLIPDLLRLGLLREAQAGRIKAGDHFRVSVAFDADRSSLSFVSRRVDAWGRDGSGRLSRPLEIETLSAIRTSVEEGRLDTMVWNHSGVAPYVPYPVTSSRWTFIGLGDDGVYRFEGLTALGRRFADEFWRALLPALEGERIEAYWSFRLGLALRLAIRNRPLARILVAYARRPDLRAKLSVTEVIRDLFRLNILREAQAGRPTTHEYFRVMPEYDPARGRLRLTSRRVDAWGRDASGDQVRGSSSDQDFWPDLKAALREGRAAAVTWDHSVVGSFIPYRWSQLTSFGVSLGEGGVYPFEALTTLARAFPEQAWQVLLPILRGDLYRPFWLFRLARAPWVYVPRVLLALRMILGRRPLRAVLLRYLLNGTLRRQIKVDRVIEDLMKLSLVHDAMAQDSGGEAAYRVEVMPPSEDGTLLFRSLPASAIVKPDNAAAQPPNGTPRRIVWDHSRIGRRVECPAFLSTRLSLSMEPDGLYEFQALSAFARVYPEKARRALPAPPA